NAIEAVTLYSELFGNLPHESVSIVQADFLDGMEFDGLYFLSKGFYDLYDGSVKGYLSLITVHEMAHQWWFGVVGNDQAMEPWLDEGLSTFAELQYIEGYYPDLVDWWWIYRVNIYEPEGWVNLSIYDYPSYLAYRNAVYLRGAAYIYEFRELMGTAEFNTGMKRYFTDNFRQIVNEEDFFGAFPNYSEDLFSEINSKYFITTP
ncbi:MAG: M1 family aminopeptidase, partial [Bellilinea sp.]